MRGTPSEKNLSLEKGIIRKWRKYLPQVTDATPIISLNEGSTPLIFSPRLSEKFQNRAQVFLKYEGLNPTGSFKDRGMTVAVSKAVEEGAKVLICASTGNTSASAAAYAARAGIKCAVILPAGKIAIGKLAQAIIYGAEIITINGNFDDALKIVVEISRKSGNKIALVNSINPHRIEGQKTASFEIEAELGRLPDFHFLPVGNAANLAAYWKGYKELSKAGMPRMMGFQAAGAAPLYYNKVIPNPETIATAIRIGNPASWKLAVDAVKESHGEIGIVTDEELIQAQQWLAKNEGIFVEPASAAGVAGMLKLALSTTRNNLFENSTIVCTLTGHGLKDTATALNYSPKLRDPVEPDVNLIQGIINPNPS